MKKWLEPISTAWNGVVTHKLRSSLTVLGIVIGVAAVISLMSIGRGAEADVISRIETLGSNLIFVNPGSTSFRGVRSAIGSAGTLTLEDAAAIAEEVPNITSIAPSFSRSLQLVAGDQSGAQRLAERVGVEHGQPAQSGGLHQIVVGRHQGGPVALAEGDQLGVHLGVGRHRVCRQLEI